MINFFLMKISRKLLQVWLFALWLVTWVGLVNVANASPINWGGATTITADTDVLTNGTTFLACNWSSTDQTVNGVTFVGATSTSMVSSNLHLAISTGSLLRATASYGSTVSPYSVLSAPYQEILIGGVYGNTTNTTLTVTLDNLAVGHTYAVQIWVNDSRGRGTQNRIETIASPGGNSVTLAYNASQSSGGVGQYAIGLFTNLVHGQTFTLYSPMVPQINALQVRDLTPDLPLTGVTYYVATNGSDANAGTSLGEPFQTISQAASVVQPGDSVRICGGTYRETVTLTASGLPGQPITFESCANETVVVSGADVIPDSSWNVYSGPIWQAPMAWTLGPGNDQIFVDGTMINIARWPNSSLDISRPSWSTADSVTIPDPGNAVVTLSDASLAQTGGYWDGARLNMGVGRVWVSQTYTVTNSSSGQLVFYAGDASNANYQPSSGNPYFLWNTLNALDAPGEWFLDAGASTLYLWTPDGDSPANHLVEAKRRTYAFDFGNCSNNVVSGLDVFAATINLGDGSANNCVDNVRAHYVSQELVQTKAFSDGTGSTGFLLNGTSNQVINCIIGWSAGNGVMLGGLGNVVSNCIIHDVDYAGGDCGAIYTAAGTSGAMIIGNTLYNSGRSVLVHRRLQGGLIVSNEIYNAGLQMQDLGCTYTYGTDGAGTRIAYNIVHDSYPPFGSKLSSGIYLDNASHNYIVDHNVCYNLGNAVQVNFPGTNDLIYNNTLFGSSHSIAGSGSPNNAAGTQFKDNIFRSAGVSVGSGAVLANNLPSSTDPLFVSIADGNFELQPGSPAIDAGVALAPYNNGYVGAAPDEGALEYGVPAWSAGARLAVGGQFLNADIGGVKPPGGLDVWNDQFRLQGGGSDIFGANDQCHFSYLRTTNQNFQVTVRITGLTAVNPWTKCGVMIRETLTAASRQAATAITPGNGVAFLQRATTGGPTFVASVAGQLSPIWLKLVRGGNSFNAFYSADGLQWSQIGTAQNIAMSNAVYVGMCLSSHVSGVPANATFDHFSVESAPPQISGVVRSSPGGLVFRARGLPGTAFRVLTSTNLVQSLSQWSSLATNVFDENGSALVTNSISPNQPKAFFTIGLAP